jgi:outer membrane protein assembly factor BamB
MHHNGTIRRPERRANRLIVSRERIEKEPHMRTIFLLVGMGVLMAAGAASADPAVGWRTDGTGVYPDARPVLEWGPGRNVVWATPMPSWSNATPVLVGGKVFVCSEPNELLCVRAADGEILWRKASTYADVKASDPQAQVPAGRPKTQKANGYTSATPTSDGKHVYALFGTGVLACFDVDGNRKWTRFVAVPPHRDWGTSASPVLVGGKLLVHIDALTAYDPATGRQLWSQPAAKWTWGTPIVCGGGKAVATSGGDIVRVSDGQVLARRAGSSAYGSPMNAGGVLFWADLSKRGTQAVKLDFDEGRGVQVRRLWRIERHKSARYYATPTLHDGLLYIINERNRFTVVDVAGGKDVFERKLTELGGGRVYPSISVAGGHVFVSHERGKTMVFKAGRRPELVATNQLDMFRSTPVFAGSRMFIRTYKTLYCIGK